MKKLIVFIILLILFASCDEDSVVAPSDRISQVEFNVNGLANLGDTLWYEAWFSYLDKTSSGEKKSHKSIGLFTVDDNGNISQNVFDIPGGYLQGAQTLYISVEEDDVPGYQVTVDQQPDTTIIDSVAGPSKYKIIAAQVEANDGTFSVGDEFLLNSDLASVNAAFILATPTDTNQTSPASGIWFVNYDTSGAMIPGLDLPDAKKNFYYEAFVEIQNTIISLGKFESASGADSSSMPNADSSGIFGAGHKPGFAFPGEDLLLNAPGSVVFPADLSGARVFITIVPPYPANSVFPFQTELIPFEVTIPAGTAINTPIQMDNMTDNFPDGYISLTMTLY